MQDGRELARLSNLKTSMEATMEQLRIYRALVVNSEGKQGFVQFVARSISDVELAVTADPNGYEILSLELMGSVGKEMNGIRTIDATEFRREYEQAVGGYRGVELFPAE